MTQIVPGSLEAAVFGTDDAAVVVERLDELARAATGAGVLRVEWYVPSVSCVAGVALEDGRDVVVRAYQPSVTEAFVSGVVRVQQHVHDAGLPAPRPLGGPLRTSWGLGRAEHVLHDPGIVALPLEAMAVSAAGLARTTDLATGVDRDGLDEHPMRVRRGLYPPPHSTIFDFEATAAGAAWIDEIAATALAALDHATRSSSAAPVLAHTDWSARNIRVLDGELVAVYDWESTSLLPEAEAVGNASVSWRSTGDLRERGPTAEEVVGYVDAYAAVRPLDAGQRRVAIAKAVHAVAYTARCEHALVPGIRDGRATGALPGVAALVG